MKTTTETHPKEHQGISACQLLRSLLSAPYGASQYIEGTHKADAACREGLVIHPADEHRAGTAIVPPFGKPYIAASTRYVSPEIYSHMRMFYRTCLEVKSSKQCEQELNDLKVSIEGHITSSKRLS